LCDSRFASNVSGKDLAERLFLILLPDGDRQGPRGTLAKKDFVWLLDEVVRTHPGLEFLAATPEFQDRYKETVIIRIFYSVNRSGTGKITLRELRKSSFPRTVVVLDEEPDINKVLDLFSYEHFYVLYCKFWELDSDHNHLIDKEDLLRYSNYSLTYRIVDRIFAEVPRKLVAPEPGYMSYEDFCWFLLSEEDKSTPTALEYWFRCVDLDGNGMVDNTEMRYFYQEQLHRMECISQEVVSFEDVVCQLHDMIMPKREGVFTMKDLRSSPLASNFFNILFNLNKFIAFEQRDPFQMRQEQALGLSDWEKYLLI
jgi:serine/threonine-protein phosphatase 2A regulatory subunit B''